MFCFNSQLIQLGEVRQAGKQNFWSFGAGGLLTNSKLRENTLSVLSIVSTGMVSKILKYFYFQFAHILSKHRSIFLHLEFLQQSKVAKRPGNMRIMEGREERIIMTTPWQNTNQGRPGDADVGDCTIADSPDIWLERMEECDSSSCEEERHPWSKSVLWAAPVFN